CGSKREVRRGKATIRLYERLRRFALLSVEKKESLRGEGWQGEQRNAPRRDRHVDIGEHSNRRNVQRHAHKIAWKNLAQHSPHRARPTNRGCNDAKRVTNSRLDKERHGHGKSKGEEASITAVPNERGNKSRAYRSKHPLRCPVRPPKDRLISVLPREVSKQARRSDHRTRERPENDGGENADERRHCHLQVGREPDAPVISRKSKGRENGNGGRLMDAVASQNQTGTEAACNERHPHNPEL